MGKPSQLARALVDDVCKLQLKNCPCCPSNVSALWKRHLSSTVRAGIAHMDFTKDNFNAIVELADKIHDDTTPNKAPSVAAIKNMNLDETQPAIPYAAPEVAAVGRGRGGRGGRRGGRGGRNNRGGRGGQSAQPAAQASGSSQPKHKGTKHPDLPAGEWLGCSMHFRWGRSAFFCSEPGSCPWKTVFATKE